MAQDPWRALQRQDLPTQDHSQALWQNPSINCLDPWAWHPHRNLLRSCLRSWCHWPWSCLWTEHRRCQDNQSLQRSGYQWPPHVLRYCLHLLQRLLRGGSCRLLCQREEEGQDRAKQMSRLLLCICDVEPKKSWLWTFLVTNSFCLCCLLLLSYMLLFMCLYNQAIDMEQN